MQNSIERTNSMSEPLSTNIVTSILSKPAVGISAGLGGGLSWLLSAIGIVGPLIGFAATVIGFVIAIYHLKIILRKWDKIKSEQKRKN